jgi:hypothetical protein
MNVDEQMHCAFRGDRSLGWAGGEMHEAFRAESGAVISPHALCSPEGRGYVSSDPRDALRLEQADGSVSAARGSGQRNASCGLPHPAGPDVRGGTPIRATVDTVLLRGGVTQSNREMTA